MLFNNYSLLYIMLLEEAKAKHETEVCTRITIIANACTLGSLHHIFIVIEIKNKEDVSE